MGRKKKQTQIKSILYDNVVYNSDEEYEEKEGLNAINNIVLAIPKKIKNWNNIIWYYPRTLLELRALKEYYIQHADYRDDIDKIYDIGNNVSFINQWIGIYLETREGIDTDYDYDENPISEIYTFVRYHIVTLSELKKKLEEF